MGDAEQSFRCEKCRVGVPVVIDDYGTINVLDAWDYNDPENHYILDKFRQRGGFDFDHHENFTLLERSAFEGCDICRILRQKIIHLSVYYPLHIKQDEPIRLRRAVMSDRQFRVEVGDAKKAILSGHVGVTSMTSPSSSTSNTVSLGEIRPLAADKDMSTIELDLQALMKQLRQWLENCTSTHEACSASAKRQEAGNNVEEPCPPMPTRVVDVGESCNAFRTRLCISANEEVSNRESRAHYVALSYCWGYLRHGGMTTKENLDERLQEIEVEELPKTIREAIVITRSLGMRYLWVDSLCIIQPIDGDISDWSSEASRMGQYYSNALLTIAATGAHSTEEGCFMERPGQQLSVSPCKIMIKTRSGIAKPYLVTPSSPSWSASVDFAPLYRRGWAFQERIMSRRIVHFTRHAMFWECSDLHACECHPDGAHLTKIDLVLHEFRVNYRRRIVPRNILFEWMKIVHRYSQMDLAIPTDKLPAISGIARMFQLATTSTYLAGIWQDTLPQGLAWISAHHRDPQLDVYVGPSWSWVSVNGAIEQFESGLDRTADWPISVLDVSIVPRNGDPYGQVCKGRLQLRGSIQTIHLADSCLIFYGPYRYKWVNQSGDESESSSVESLDSIYTRPFTPPRPLPDDFSVDIHFDVLPAQIIDLPLELTCLLLCIYADAEMPIYGALILCPTGVVQNEYRRIGFAKLRSRTWFQVVDEQVIDLI